MGEYYDDRQDHGVCTDGDMSMGPPHKKSREAKNIQFAHGLSGRDLMTVLQHELLRARSRDPDCPEVTLPASLVHDIKFRLSQYISNHGEIERPPTRRSGSR